MVALAGTGSVQWLPERRILFPANKHRSQVTRQTLTSSACRQWSPHAKVDIYQGGCWIVLHHFFPSTDLGKHLEDEFWSLCLYKASFGWAGSQEISSFSERSGEFHFCLSWKLRWNLWMGACKNSEGLCSSASGLELLSLNSLQQGYGLWICLKIRTALILPFFKIYYFFFLS